MADTAVAITAGTGTNIDTRTESTNSNHRQVVVLGDPTTNAGVAPVDGTAGLKVNLGADNDVTLATLPDTGSSDLATINSNTAYGTVTGGGVEASALRVTLANDSTGVLSVDDNGGSLTIDGTVTANLSATDNAVLDTIETNTDFGTVTGGGVEASALRVTLANDSTGVLSVDDNGGTLTIDNADITTIAGAVSGTEMQVDVVAALPAGSNAIGKLASNSGVDIGDVTINNTTSTPVHTDHSITGLNHGVKTVTSAGTDEALASSTTCKRVVVQAQTDNTGLIAVGGTGVDATEATGTGIILFAGDSFEIETDNLADIFIDSTVNGEGVRYTYFT